MAFPLQANQASDEPSTNQFEKEINQDHVSAKHRLMRRNSPYNEMTESR